MAFDNPYYKCRIGANTYTVDVTLSAPPQMDNSSPVVKDLILYLNGASVKGRGVQRICDFGAGKLRNTEALIDAGFTVCAVEHPEQFARRESFTLTGASLERLEKAKKLGKSTLEKLKSLEKQEIVGQSEFLAEIRSTIGSRLVSQHKSLILEHAGHRFISKRVPASKDKLDYLLDTYKGKFTYLSPKEFKSYPHKFDAILMIFVIHTVPYPEDRSEIIDWCSKKLKKGGLLFWATPWGDTNMKKYINVQFGFNDGWLMNIEKTLKTFYTEFKVPAIDQMVRNRGFEFVRRLEFFKNPARIYRNR